MSAPLATPAPAEWTRIRSEGPARWPLCALVMGAIESAEFAPVATELRARTNAIFAPDLPSALRAARDENLSPDCLVLLESRPGELSRASFDDLRAVAPLARVVCVLGSWCEGEFRSGQPWPAAARVYWHQFRSWFQQELAAIERGDCPAFCLPITATEEERLLQSCATPSVEVTTSATPRRVAIHSNRREMRDLLADTCQRLGLHVLPGSDCPSGGTDETLTAAIWDLATVEPAEIAAFAAAAERAPLARWIVLAGFLREATRAALMRQGAREILSKPLVVEQLQGALATCLELAAPAPRETAAG